MLESLNRPLVFVEETVITEWIPENERERKVETRVNWEKLKEEKLQRNMRDNFRSGLSIQSKHQETAYVDVQEKLPSP